MQTTINVKQAFGIAGEIYDLTPYRVDAREVATAVTFGKAAGVSATGAFGAMAASTYTKFAGIFVRPKEEISYGTVKTSPAVEVNPLGATMTVPAGRTVQIMSMGRVVIEKPGEAWVEGDSVYVTSAGAFTKATATSSVNNTLVGKVVVGGGTGDPLAVIQLG